VGTSTEPGCLTRQYRATLPRSDLGATHTRIYHSTDTTEEWRQHNYNTGSTHRTVIELASHIQISSKTNNITTPTRKHADMRHLATRQNVRPPLRSHPPRAIQKHGRTHQLPEQKYAVPNYIYTHPVAEKPP
jgi:hypothetical protein